MEPYGNKVKIRHKIMSALPGIGRYTAGPYPVDSVKAAIKLSKEGYTGILNILGEHDTDPIVIDATIKDYEQVIDEISKNKKNLLSPAISLKPTQFGFHETDKDGLVSKRLLSLIKKANQEGIFVWIDMENKDTTEYTLSLYKSAITLFNPELIGICVQANLFRTKKDLEELLEYSKKKALVVNIRLVRGIYKEAKEFAYTKREQMHDELARLMHMSFSKGGPKVKISIASHHPLQIIRAIALDKKYPGKLSGFQFLYGAVKKIPKILTQKGFKCTYYIPSGPRFFRYGVRRIRENPGALFGLMLSPLFEMGNATKITDYLDGKTKIDLEKENLPMER
ncbi:MAG TPA: proline dehydrogenase family protein [Candidatus Bilamarchaeaceae archaeon]|nr:proline dehydrogenase family protein [Candidatus Bilamarchaeaceae archaeon]